MNDFEQNSGDKLFAVVLAAAAVIALTVVALLV
jgi:hypothetical protein